MRTILRIGCSPRGASSESFQLSRNVVDMLLDTDPTAHVVNRMIGGNAMLHVDADCGISQKSAFDVSLEGSMIEPKELRGSSRSARAFRDIAKRHTRSEESIHGSNPQRRKARSRFGRDVASLRNVPCTISL
jgi:hypothetical protein